MTCQENYKLVARYLITPKHVYNWMCTIQYDITLYTELHTEAEHKSEFNRNKDSS